MCSCESTPVLGREAFQKASLSLSVPGSSKKKRKTLGKTKVKMCVDISLKYGFLSIFSEQIEGHFIWKE